MTAKRQTNHNQTAGVSAIAATPLERFVRDAYADLDRVTAERLVRLGREEGVRPSCRAGCSHCCQHYILTNRAEAHALGQYVKREFSRGQIRALRGRTRQWHDWEAYRAGRQAASRRRAPRASFPPYIHRCPLLVASRCSAYPARPATCRTHFVSSPPRFCHDANDPATRTSAPTCIAAVAEAADPFAQAVRAQIEKAGYDYTRSILLLPHWLATEMGWDFSSPTEA
jgi:Fe-S-cluster containining protein